MKDEFEYEVEEEYMRRDEEHPGQAEVADLLSMNDEILSRHMNDILKSVNTSIADGTLSGLLDLPILTEKLAHSDIHVQDMKFYHVNRTDMLADIRFWTEIKVFDDGHEVDVEEDLGCTLGFSFADGRCSCAYKGMWDLFTKPSRQVYPELDQYLNLNVESSVIEDRADQFWFHYCEEALLDPNLRKPETLAARMGLVIERTEDAVGHGSCLYFGRKTKKRRKNSSTEKEENPERDELEKKRAVDRIVPPENGDIRRRRSHFGTAVQYPSSF